MKKRESGQALVLVLLSLSVVLTVILFVLSRSVTDVAISTEQADSVRAFSAAEAGVENALITGKGSYNIDIGDASYSVDVTKSSENSPYFNYPVPLLSGETMTNWFVAHDVNGNIVCNASSPCFKGDTLQVCWGNSGTSADTAETPAIEVSVYYETTPGSVSTIKIARATFDPNVARRGSNNFASPDAGICTVGDVSYSFKKTITMSGLGIPLNSYSNENGLIFAKIRMLYNTNVGHVIGSNVNFPGNTMLTSQGLDITSTGTSGTEGNLSNRRVSVFKGWPEFPFSGLAIYYPYGITK